MLEEIKKELKKQGAEKGIKLGSRKLQDAGVAILTSLTDKTKKSYGLAIDKAVERYFLIAYRK